MKKVRVYGTRPKGHPFPIVSWAIRLVEWSDISHATVEVEDRIYHAYFDEVRYEDKADWVESNEIRYAYELELPEDTYEAMIDFMDGYAGPKKGYFVKLFGGILPTIIKRVFGKHIKNTFTKGMENNATCTQLVRFLAKRFWNYKVPDRPYAENFSTKDFVRMMEDNK